MSVYVFVGPTIGTDEASKELDATFLPPAAQGDVYRIASEGARAIGIIDGYFENVPAVWHKEILWAMSQGVHVFGAAKHWSVPSRGITRVWHDRGWPDLRTFSAWETRR